jgi:hypothetical protein
VPSVDGKRLFAVGSHSPVRWSASIPARGQFVPYLYRPLRGGARVLEGWRLDRLLAYPERTLWRSRADGSERLQLTFPPLMAALPRFSPDASR